MAKAKARVLVAGTAGAVNAVHEALAHDDAHIVAAYSVREALERCAAEQFDVIACSVRFDESRMFEFLQALTVSEPPCSARIVALRGDGGPLKASVRDAVRHALEALGVERFVDLQEVSRLYGAAAARETLRKLVLEKGFVP